CIGAEEQMTGTYTQRIVAVMADEPSRWDGTDQPLIRHTMGQARSGRFVWRFPEVSVALPSGGASPQPAGRRLTDIGPEAFLRRSLDVFSRHVSQYSRI